MFWSEADCGFPKAAYGTDICRWESTGPYFDCSLIWPTAAPQPGCCAGDSSYAQDLCAATESMSKCQRMSSCHWIVTDDPEECVPPPDEQPGQPGCCDITGYANPIGGWKDICRAYWNKDDCGLPLDSAGNAR